MKNLAKALLILAALTFSVNKPAQAQSCNPAAVHYIVRDESGTILSADQLKSLVEKLPKNFGSAELMVGEVLFADDGVTFYWPESSEQHDGKKVPVLEFVDSGTCAMKLGQVDLSYHGKTMHLVFNLEIGRYQDDRRPVIDALPFRTGTFLLDQTGWSHRRDQLIPATKWIRGGLLDLKSGE